MPALLSLLSPSIANADNQASGLVSVYQDDDDLSVISPQVDARVQIDRLDVEAGYEADIITAASVDVITAASPRGYEETRHGLTFGLLWRPDLGISFGARYLPSWEVDYQSHGVALRTAYEWLDRRLEQRLDARVNFDQVGRYGEPRSEWRDLTTVGVSPSLAWVFDRFTVGNLVYEIQSSDGFQASRYRFVPVAWTGTGTTVSVPEVHPERRVRHAVGAGLRHAITRSWFGALGYRFYLDNWGVSSHTVDGSIQHAISGDDLVFGLELRGYTQGDAEFYQRDYAATPGTLPRYRSRDKMLAESWSGMAGVRGEASFGALGFLDDVRGIMRMDVYDQHFENFAPLDGRRAVIIAAGLILED